MVKRNQLNLKAIARYNECGYNRETSLIMEIFKTLYGLNALNYEDSLIANDSDLDELLYDSDIHIVRIIDEGVIEYGDNDEIINKEEGAIIGYAILEQDGVKYVLDILAADDGCQMNDAYNFASVNLYGGK